MRVRVAAVGAVVVASTLLSVPAAADRDDLRDRKDAGAQDIRSISHGHGRATAGRVIHTIVSARRWSSKRLSCPSYQECRSTLRVFISTDRDGWYERDIFFMWRDERLRALIYRYTADKDCGSLQDPTCEDRNELLGRLRVWRPSPRSIRFAIPLDLLGARGRDSYAWQAWFWYRRSDPCPRLSYHDRARDDYSCSDYAPDRGYWVHDLN